MLHIETVEPHTLGLLNRLMAEPELMQFRLVGGTALSLQIGHRNSIDLDFFSNEDFVAQEVRNMLLEKGYEVKVLIERGKTLIAEIEDVKVDFIKFAYPFAHPIIETDASGWLISEI